MLIYWRSAILIYLVVVFWGCTGGQPTRWGHFHGDPSNQGLQLIDSGFALSSSWSSNPYRITSSSPVIGLDFQQREVLYVGTTNAKLIAIRTTNGTEKWQRSLGGADSNTRIVSSASVSDKGDIYIITNRKTAAGRLQSILHKVDQSSNSKWSFVFPENGYTTASPKVITSSNRTLIFIYVSVEMGDDIQGELMVLRDDGTRAQLIDRKSLGTCRFDIPGARLNKDDLMSTRDQTWDMIGEFPVKNDASSIGLPDRFVDPTAAVFTAKANPLIAIADNLCNIGVYEWSGTELSVLWREEHDFYRHSSTAVLPNGLMVFGRHDGKVVAHDVQTGVKMWEFDAGQAVLATPAGSPGELLFVMAKNHLQAINAADGTLVHDAHITSKLPLMGSTHSSPAVTSNLVYVASFEMLTATHDLKTRTSALQIPNSNHSVPAYFRMVPSKATPYTAPSRPMATDDSPLP